jgi:hypothetical protein
MYEKKKITNFLTIDYVQRNKFVKFAIFKKKRKYLSHIIRLRIFKTMSNN